MNYGEVTNLLVILFFTYSLLISMVVYVILEFMYRWKKVGVKKIIPRILISFLSGPLFVFLYFLLLYYQSKTA